jgi:hypothetical protein
VTFYRLYWRCSLPCVSLFSSRISVAWVLTERQLKKMINRSRDFVPSARESGQSHGRLSTTHLLHAAGIRQQRVHRESEDRKPVQFEGQDAVVTNSLLIPREEQGLEIPARHRPVLLPFAEVLAERIYVDASQSQGIHEYTATVSPMVSGPQQVRQGAHKQHHARENLHGVHKQEDYCLRRSTAASFVAQIANLLPGSTRKMRLQAFAFESNLAEPETAATPPFSDNTAETLFNKGL